MKRPSYFISARSASADLLASELVLAINDQFPKVECMGIFGEWTGRTRSTRLGELSVCLSLGLHDKAEVSAEAELWRDNLFAELEKLSPQLAIIVGYSFLNHELAQFFKKLNVPVVLYEITPAGAVAGIDPCVAGQCVDLVLGISPLGSELVKKAGIPYYYIGSPYKDRVDRVIVEAQSLGLTAGQKIVSIFPGARVEGFLETLPVFQQLAEFLAKVPGLQVVLSVADGLIADTSIKILGKSLDHYIQQAGAASASLRVVTGMHLELLSLSTLAITGCGAITVECGLFQVPVLCLYPAGGTQSGPRSMLNQLATKALVAEFNSNTPLVTLAAYAQQLIGPSQQRDILVKVMAEVKRSLQGFAADNAAEYIGQEIGKWKSSRLVKGIKAASPTPVKNADSKE